MFFNVALLKSGLAGNRECAQRVLPCCPSDPGSSSWQCPVLGSAEEGFLLQAGHSLAVCSSWLHRCGDELHRGSFLMVFRPCEVLSPSGLLGLVRFNLSHVPSCGVLWLLHRGSSQDSFIFSCQLLHFFFPLLSVLRAAVLSTSPNYSFSDFLEIVTFLIILFIEIYLSALKRTRFEFSKQ